MTDRPEHEDAFSPEEQRALAAWTTPAPATDLAARVLAVDAGRRRRRALLALAAAVLAVMALGVAAAVVGLGGSASNGSRLAAGRTTIDMGGRAIAVAEAGTDVRWQVAASGSAKITQRSGNVFYRVEPGGPFVVSTPQGTIKVLGTCFRVEVKSMRAIKAGIGGAAVGAAAATIVLVSVYEGKVMSAAPGADEGVEVAAGQVALMAQRGQPKIVDDLPSAAAVSGESMAAGRAAGATPISGTTEQQNQQLRRRTQQLESEVASLRNQLDSSNGKVNKSKVMDLSQEDLKYMASRCELRWDSPSYGSTPTTISREDQEKIGLTPEEAEMANKVLAEFHQRQTAQLQRLYAAATGNTSGVDGLSPWAMISEITDKSTVAERRTIFQRLANERAGLQAPPADLSGALPLEKLMRLLTTEGDAIEKAIGEQVGPDLARRHRRLHGGYGSKSRSSSGCPKQ